VNLVGQRKSASVMTWGPVQPGRVCTYKHCR
jgi:hypothetical protein